LPGYQTVFKTVGNTKVAIWGSSDGISDAADTAAEALQFFQGIFGPYPHRELNVVEVPMEVFFGMNYDAIIFISKNIISSSWNK
jgi:hypothetical protein